MVLLIASIIYYLLSGNGVLILYPLFASLATWGLLKALKKVSGSADGKSDDTAAKKRRIVLLLELAALLGILIALKYTKLIHGGSIATPLGLSFYTFILLGYFIEVYNGLTDSNESFFKTVLIGMYFPVMISGPIFQIRETGKQFFERHRLDYKNITFGAQRMLWGFFKELVISERLAVVVNTIYNNDTAYPGAYIMLGTVGFALQLYTNFSGCMDIVIGASQCFGIILPENFTTPFFARSISEYWRRWHITLGVWMRENVFYPLLRTGMITKLGKTLKGRFGKKKGKQYTTYVAMFILWFSVGLWHGGEMKYVIGSGLLHWAYIVIGEISLPFFTWLFAEKMHINMKGKFADCVRVVRTFILVCIGDLFFRADNVPHALRMLKESVTVFNPQIFVDGSLLNLGIDIVDWGIILVSLVILTCVSVMQYKMENGKAVPKADGDSKNERTSKKVSDFCNVREYIAERPIVLRWFIYMAFLFMVILIAEYGPGYSAAEFIYKDF
ncbi:MBOAT family O-acyltransferase [Butyrivibrio sp.]|uniref:MBOAT family O-acyltransferase n=1 Tax=Butyrivibrio sp. TaxID=28121 RepID=UPI0025BC6896|nr:MBOAT family O-acyltransferase [Butyrivibrio sp.]